MGLTKLSLKRPVSVVILIAAIVIFGVMSIFQLDMQLTPDMEMPMFIVITSYIGVSPEDMDELVSQEIEEAGATLKGITSIQSYSAENISQVLFQYDYGTDMDDAYMDLLEAINAKVPDLPKDCGKPTIIEMSMNQMPTMQISISVEGDVDLLNYVNDEVLPEIDKIKDVAKKEISGGEEAYISVCLDQQKMQQYGVNMNTIVTYINAAKFKMPVGSADFGDILMNVNISAEYDTIKELLEIPITTSKGTVIKLSDVATVTQKYKQITEISRYNGLNDVTLSVYKRQSAGDVSVANSVKKVFEKLGAGNTGIKYDIIYDSSEEVLSSIKSVAETLILGMALSMLILFLFFGDFKGSLIVGCSMPISVLLTLILMNFMGFSLNIITMGGLVIGVGMMVDNSIVVLESCFRMRDEGREYFDAALDGTRFVFNSIVASTATSVVVFLPIALTNGLSGQFFKPLGFTIVFSLISSLISAVTLVPLFFSKYKPVEKKKSPVTKFVLWISDVYGRVIRKILRHRFIALFIAIALLVGAGYGATFLNMELMPATDQGQIKISVVGRQGLNIEEYDKFLTEIESMVAANPDVEKYSLSASSSNASGNVTAYLKKDRSRETWQVAEEWKLRLQDVTGFDVTVAEQSDSTMSMGGGESAEVVLEGTNMEDLEKAEEMVSNMMKEVPGVLSVSSSLSTSGMRAKIVIDPLKAANVGFTPAAVASNVNMALSGVDTIKVINNRKEYTVKVEYDKDLYKNVSDLKNLSMTSPLGRNIILSDISEIVYTDSPEQLQRKDGKYSVTVTADVLKDSKFTAQDEITKKAEKFAYPGDVSIGSSLSNDIMMQEMQTLGIALVVSIILVLMLMAMQFESLRFSFMVMWCIPFSLVGSIALMLISQITISMVALMGILMLIGTVVNNGILYVDTANQFGKKMEREEALAEAGRIRLRPILMTSLTTILAMVPMAIGLGEGTESMESMGQVIIGGYVASTFLTLLLLPVFYLFMDKKKKKEKKKKDRRNRKASENQIIENPREEIITEAEDKDDKKLQMDNKENKGIQADEVKTAGTETSAKDKEIVKQPVDTDDDDDDLEIVDIDSLGDD